MTKPNANELIHNIAKLHTTALGEIRIQKNLSLSSVDAVLYCKEKILAPEAIINRLGKNWYITNPECEITVNASSYTIITAHRPK